MYIYTHERPFWGLPEERNPNRLAETSSLVLLKKPKMEGEEDFNGFTAGGENGETQSEREEQEQVLVALIEHRTKEVEKNQWRLAHYKAEVVTIGSDFF